MLRMLARGGLYLALGMALGCSGRTGLLLEVTTQDEGLRVDQLRFVLSPEVVVEGRDPRFVRDEASSLLVDVTGRDLVASPYRLLLSEDRGAAGGTPLLAAVLGYRSGNERPVAFGALPPLGFDDGDVLLWRIVLERRNDVGFADTGCLIWDEGASVDPQDCDCDGVRPPEDCDDLDAQVSPRRSERCANGKDDDCDGATDEVSDDDEDGADSCADCDEGDDTVFPGAPELCDGLDNDCDGACDEDLDGDGDGVTTCGSRPAAGASCGPLGRQGLRRRRSPTSVPTRKTSATASTTTATAAATRTATTTRTATATPTAARWRRCWRRPARFRHHLAAARRLQRRRLRPPPLRARAVQRARRQLRRRAPRGLAVFRTRRPRLRPRHRGVRRRSSGGGGAGLGPWVIGGPRIPIDGALCDAFAACDEEDAFRCAVEEAATWKLDCVLAVRRLPVDATRAARLEVCPGASVELPEVPEVAGCLWMVAGGETQEQLRVGLQATRTSPTGPALASCDGRFAVTALGTALAMEPDTVTVLYGESRPPAGPRGALPRGAATPRPRRDLPRRAPCLQYRHAVIRVLQQVRSRQRRHGAHRARCAARSSTTPRRARSSARPSSGSTSSSTCSGRAA